MNAAPRADTGCEEEGVEGVRVSGSQDVCGLFEGFLVLSERVLDQHEKVQSDNPMSSMMPTESGSQKYIRLFYFAL